MGQGSPTATLALAKKWREMNVSGQVMVEMLSGHAPSLYSLLSIITHQGKLGHEVAGGCDAGGRDKSGPYTTYNELR
jgi:hypothetical protein